MMENRVDLAARLAAMAASQKELMNRKDQMERLSNYLK